MCDFSTVYWSIWKYETFLALQRYTSKFEVLYRQGQILHSKNFQYKNPSKGKIVPSQSHGM